MTKRFSQTLSRCWVKVIDNDQLNWDEKLDTDLIGYCASKQASTKHYVLYQQHMRLPIDIKIKSSFVAADAG